MENVIIIGTGCAGWTAAIYTGRANLDPLVLSGTQLGGQLTTTTEVENFPGFPDGVMGPELMGKMQQQAEKFGAKVEYKKVNEITRNEDGTFGLETDQGTVQSKTVIIATGAAPRYLGLENEMNSGGPWGDIVCDLRRGVLSRRPSRCGWWRGTQPVRKPIS